MNKRTKKILGASLSLAAFSFGYAQNVQAQSCVVLPTCESICDRTVTEDDSFEFVN